MRMDPIESSKNPVIPAPTAPQPAAEIPPRSSMSELTGQPIDTYSEAWRHECECRWLLALPGKHERHAFLAKVAAKRGQAAADRLKIDTLTLYELRKKRPS